MSTMMMRDNNDNGDNDDYDDFNLQDVRRRQDKTNILYNHVPTGSNQQPQQQRYISITTSSNQHEQQEEIQIQTQHPIHGNDENNSNNYTNDRNHLPMNPSSPVLARTIDECIELVGYGKFHTMILIVSGLCFAADAMQIMMLSFITREIQYEWNLSSNEVALSTSMIFVGAFSGTLLLGPYADIYGRRIIFLISGTIITFFSMIGIALLTHQYYVLLIMIFCVGFGVGGLIVPFDIFAECLPSNQRGQQLLYIEYFWSVGSILVVILAYYMLQYNWRYYTVICAIPSLLSVLLGYYFVPESPRWLIAQGKHNDAIFILKYAAKLNGFSTYDIDHYLFPSNIEIMPEQHHSQQQQNESFLSSMKDLFQPKWRYIILRLWGLWSAMAFGYYGTILTIARIFQKKVTISDNDGNNQQQRVEFDFSAILTSTVAELVGLTFIVFTIDKIGRIPTQMVSFASAGICVFFMTLIANNNSDQYRNDAPHHDSNNTDYSDSTTSLFSTGIGTSRFTPNTKRVLLIIFSFLARIFEMAASCVTWVMTPEILTTDVRSTGHSTSNAVARVGAFSCPFIVQDMSLLQVGIVMLLVHAMAIMCVTSLPETMGKHLGSSSSSHHNSIDDILHELDMATTITDENGIIIRDRINTNENRHHFHDDYDDNHNGCGLVNEDSVFGDTVRNNYHDQQQQNNNNVVPLTSRSSDHEIT